MVKATWIRESDELPVQAVRMHLLVENGEEKRERRIVQVFPSKPHMLNHIS